MAALPAAAAARSRQLSDASFEVLFALLPAMLATGAGVLVEGNFRRGSHEPALLRACADRAVIQLLCRVPEPLRQARIAARLPDHTGHPHAAQQAYREECDAFLDLPGSHIQVDGDAPLDESIARARVAALAHGFCV